MQIGTDYRSDLGNNFGDSLTITRVSDYTIAVENETLNYYRVEGEFSCWVYDDFGDALRIQNADFRLLLSEPF